MFALVEVVARGLDVLLQVELGALDRQVASQRPRLCERGANQQNDAERDDRVLKVTP